MSLGRRPASASLDQLLADLVQRGVPCEVRWKDGKYSHDDTWHKVKRWVVDQVASLFVGRKAYLDRYATTIYPHVYFPGRLRARPGVVLRAMRHERVHLLDQRRHPWWFPLSYVLVLPAVFTWRARWEERGYAQNFIMDVERYGVVQRDTWEQTLAAFRGRAYAWMDPFGAERRLARLRERAERKEISGLWPWELL